MKKVLVLDGGGAKGILQNQIITELENHVGKKSCEIFDLIVGTSVGAINGAMHATGAFTADKDNELFDTVVLEVFGKKRLIPPIYKDSAINKAFDANLGKGYRMNQCKTRFMCTSVSAIDKETHLFRSWESQEPLFDVIRRSFAAPLYFGQVVDVNTKQVWLDGGTGIANTPLIPAIDEIQQLNWDNESDPVLLVNIGTGFSLEHSSFNEAKKYHFLRQIGEYLDPASGGLARYQSLSYQRSVLKYNKEISGVIIDGIIPKKLDKMDNVKALGEYKKRGTEFFEKAISQNPDLIEKLKA